MKHKAQSIEIAVSQVKKIQLFMMNLRITELAHQNINKYKSRNHNTENKSQN